MFGGKRNGGCKDKKRGRRPKVLNKTAIIVFSLEQVHEKQNLETPEMAKKEPSTPPAKQRSARLKFV